MNSPKQDDTQFKPSRLTIRLKLEIIISFILFLSFSLIIFLASYFFKRDSESRIQLNSMNITNILGVTVRSGILTLSKNTKLIGSDLLAFSPEGENKRLQELQALFFNRESDFISVGVYTRENEYLSLLKSTHNSYFFDTHHLQEKDIFEIREQYADNFLRSFENETILLNSSPGFKFPVMAISLPFRDVDEKPTIIIAFVKLKPFLDIFRSGGTTISYLVGGDGKVIAHPKDADVLVAKDLAKSPIVRRMFASKSDSIQVTRYEEQDMKYLGSFKKLGVVNGGIISTVSEKIAFQAVYNIQRRNVYLMIVVLSLAVLFVFFYAKSMSKPILQLVDVAHEVERGNYHNYLTPHSGDEIGMLTHSFNTMSKGLDEREKMKDAFGKFVNTELAELAMKGEIKLGGERKYCAIFFSDIRSFTAISEKLEPEEVVEFLNQYMTEMIRCINQTGGVVDKFIGDAIMATWGALRPLPNETEAAINASLMMREVLLKFNIGRGSDKKPIIKIGCGINSGYVVSGQIGSNERLEYTVIGDAVNLASRVEALNKPFGTDILITEESYQKVASIFHVEKMQAIKVKGKAKPQEIYTVLGRQDDANCPQNMRELRARVGIEYHDSASSGGEEKEVKYEILE